MPKTHRLSGEVAEPLLVSLLASAAFTVLNVAHEVLTDEQEARVLVHHAAYLRTAAPR